MNILADKFRKMFNFDNDQYDERYWQWRDWVDFLQLCDVAIKQYREIYQKAISLNELAIRVKEMKGMRLMDFESYYLKFRDRFDVMEYNEEILVYSVDTKLEKPKYD